MMKTDFADKWHRYFMDWMPFVTNCVKKQLISLVYRTYVLVVPACVLSLCVSIWCIFQSNDSAQSHTQDQEKDLGLL